MFRPIAQPSLKDARHSLSHGFGPINNLVHRLAFIALNLLLVAVHAQVPQPQPTTEQISAELRAQRAFATESYLGDMMRLERVAYALLRAASPYCAHNRKYSLGVPPTAAMNLPRDVRQGFMETRGLSLPTESLFLHIPATSPSAAGVTVGEVLISITDQATAKKVPPDWVYDRPASTLAQNATFLLRLRRGDQERSVSIRPQLICDWRPVLVRKDELVAEISSEGLTVSTGLMRFVRNDDELAMLISHELAHAIIEQAPPSGSIKRGQAASTTPAPPEAERSADYLGTYVALLGGFNVDRAQEIWRRIAGYPPSGSNGGLAHRHAFSAERGIWLRATLAEVRRKKTNGEQLLPDQKSLPTNVDIAASVLASAAPSSVPSAGGVDPRLARVEDVPFLTSEGRSGYQRFLSTPLRPRAFAVSPAGGAWSYRSGSDAASEALKGCVELAKAPCYLYAVDDAVVWNPETAEHLPQPSSTDGIDPRLTRVRDVPMLNDEGRSGYERFLNLTVRPRAFAIGPKGDGTASWAYKSGVNASADALAYCTVLTRGRPCYLYAVDDRVVWSLSGAPALPLASAESAADARSLKRPPASGFADIHDLKAIPLPDDQLASYRSFLEKPLPRAFVITQEGFGRYWLGAAAMENALSYCERVGDNCWLYAVDDDVVWQADRAKRISRRAQLPEQPEESLFLR